MRLVLGRELALIGIGLLGHRILVLILKQLRDKLELVKVNRLLRLVLLLWLLRCLTSEHRSGCVVMLLVLLLLHHAIELGVGRLVEEVACGWEG